MPAYKSIDLANAKKTWQSKKTQKQIKRLYLDLAQKLKYELAMMPSEKTMDEQLRVVWLKNHIKALNKEISYASKKIYQETQDSMLSVCQAVVDAENEFMKDVGLKVTGAFSHVPSEVVEKLMSGKVYKGKWIYSERLWKDAKKISRDLEKIVASGVAANKSTFDIAKDLEKYVSPDAKKPWDWSKVYPGAKTKVDYNAQRLARTLIQHAYQLSLRECTKNNPFVDGIIWHSAFAEGRTCELCMDRDGRLYKVGQEPLDHPNGLCYFEVAISKSSEEIAEEIANWYNGEENPKLEKYVQEAKGRVR